jgi:calcineurin-like phosphoesterase family protein
MSAFFTSDLHFGHANIIKYCDRPFSSVDEMNEIIISRWNDVVTPEDTVYVLGDVAMGKIKETLPLCLQLNGTKHLISGNHDRCHPVMKNFLENRQMYYDAGFESINEQWLDLNLGDALVDMCHFPFEGDSHDEDRFDDWRPTDRGQWLLHGHVHEKWQVRGKMINCGVDVWNFSPVPVDTVRQIMIESTYGDLTGQGSD